MSDLEDAWDAVRAAMLAGWIVARPTYHDERQRWVVWAPLTRPYADLGPL